MSVAEQFGTMASDLSKSIGPWTWRAPGTDMMTARALRSLKNDSVYTFPDDVKALLTYFGPEELKAMLKLIQVLGQTFRSIFLVHQLIQLT